MQLLAAERILVSAQILGFETGNDLSLNIFKGDPMKVARRAQGRIRRLRQTRAGNIQVP